MEFQDKIVLITGAASGIGRAAAIAFAAQGARVVLTDVNTEGGGEALAEIQAAGGQAMFRALDVCDSEAVAALIAEIIERYGRLDIALNNAGIVGLPAKTADTRLSDWEKIMQVNASGVFYCMKAELAHMTKQGNGVILNTASIAGLRAMPQNIAYTASKHAVVGMTKTAAWEYAKSGIRINAICPAFSITPLFNPKEIEQYAAGLPEKLKAQIPLKRFADVQEQVEAMLWLCSDKASYVTGLAMAVDGGLTA